MRCLLLAMISLCTLSACQSMPPKPVQPFYVAGLDPQIVQKHGGFRLDQAVKHPTTTRYASLASRAPQYGLLASPEPNQPAFAVQTLSRLFPVTTTVNAEFLRQLQVNAPTLATQHRPTAEATWRFQVLRVAIFGKDVSNTHCEAMWFMRADLLDKTGSLLWSSGYANSRLSDSVAYPCARIAEDPAFAAQVVQASLRDAIADIIEKIVSAP
jgi:hypothetical protein